MSEEGTSFAASLNKIQTTVDGGWRVSFDIPASESEAMVALSKWRENLLQVGIIVNKNSSIDFLK